MSPFWKKYREQVDEQDWEELEEKYGKKEMGRRRQKERDRSPEMRRIFDAQEAMPIEGSADPLGFDREEAEGRDFRVLSRGKLVEELLLPRKGDKRKDADASPDKNGSDDFLAGVDLGSYPGCHFIIGDIGRVDPRVEIVSSFGGEPAGNIVLSPSYVIDLDRNAKDPIRRIFSPNPGEEETPTDEIPPEPGTLRMRYSECRDSDWRVVREPVSEKTTLVFSNAPTFAKNHEHWHPKCAKLAARLKSSPAEVFDGLDRDVLFNLLALELCGMEQSNAEPDATTKQHLEQNRVAGLRSSPLPAESEKALQESIFLSSPTVEGLPDRTVSQTICISDSVERAVFWYHREVTDLNIALPAADWSVWKVAWASEEEEGAQGEGRSSEGAVAGGEELAGEEAGGEERNGDGEGVGERSRSRY